MRLYAAVAFSGFRRYATYRVATAAGVFTNTVFGFIVAYTYIALWNARPHLGGYDRGQALAFVWISQALLAAAALMGGGFEDELQERIRSGDVAVDLYRPADLQLWWLANDLGRAGFQLLGRGVVPLAVGALAFELALPAEPLTWLAFLLSVLLGLLVGFGMRYMVGLAAFWLLDGAGLTVLSSLLGTFLSGMLLPWSAMLQVPADVLLGRHHGAGLIRALAFQAGWAAVMLGLGRMLQAVATRKVVVQGG